MSPKTLPAALLCALALPAQSVTIDSFWQRESGCKVFDHLEPFRSPQGVDISQRGQLHDLLDDLVFMLKLRVAAKPEQLSTDKFGREICDHPKWKEAFERVQQNSLKMEGWLGHLLLHSTVLSQRQAACYGMFYFNNPQNVIHMISFIPGEPIRDLRQETMRRALNYMAVHYPESRPLDPARPEIRFEVPAYDFNPLPYMQLLDTPKHLDQAQGLWFLTEVLKIRPDMGKAWFDELRARLHRLAGSESKLVRNRLGNLLLALKTKASEAAATREKPRDTSALQTLISAIDKELFPPIRHISLGYCELHPSPELNELIRSGQNVLASSSILQPGSARSGSLLRYGLRVARVPSPLDKLGIPKGAIIVTVNQIEVRNTALLRKAIEDAISLWRKRMDEHEVHVATFRSENKDPKKKPRPAPALTFKVEYIHQGQALMRDFRFMR